MDERQANQTLYQKAASVGMTVEQFKQMKEDKEYRDEMKAIEEEEQADEQLLQGRFPETIGSGRVPVETPIDESYVPYSEARHDAESEGNFMGPEAHAAMRARGGMHKDEFPDDKKAYASGFIESMSPGTSPSESPTDFSASNYQTEAPPEAPPVEAPEGDFEGFMPPEAAAGEQADIQRDENDPVVKEAKELQKRAAEGDPEAQKAQEEMYDGLSKEEKAMAKEEFGNYYIGPGGYAINLETVDADNQRGANFLMLQHVPVHARAQMLANWGYIDQEDVDNLPDSPTVQKAKIDAETELAKQNSINETDITKIDKTVAGTLNVTKVQIQAQKDLNASNNTLKRELALSDDEFRKLDLEDKNWRFMERQELEAYMHNNNIDLDEKKLEALQDHQLAQINLGYSKIRSVERVEANMLKFKDKQWSQKYKLATDQEKRSMLLFEHTKGMDVINMAMNNGQLDLAAATAQQMGVPFIPDYKAYMTAHAKASSTDPTIAAIIRKYHPDMKPSALAGKYATYKDGLMKKYGSAPSEPGMPSDLDNWILADPARGNTWEQMTAPEKEQYNSKDHWRAVKITEAVNNDLRNSAYKHYHGAITNRTLNIDSSTDAGTDADADSGADADASAGADTGADEKTTTDEQVSPEVNTPLVDIKNKIMDQEGYGFTRKSKGPKKGTETTRYSEAEALKKSLKEGERLAKQYLQGTMAGKKRKFIHMKQVVDHFRANPEELERRGNQFQHYILTQIQKGTGKR